MKPTVLSNKKLEQLLIGEEASIKEALKQMALGGEKILFVVKGPKLLGTLSDGDIRRVILQENHLGASIAKAYNRSPVTSRPGYNLSQVKKIMLEKKIEVLPIVDEAGVLLDVLLWNNVFSAGQRPQRVVLEIPVVIMAGGKGVRMDPFTKILPKPLLPFGEKPMVEIVMDRFAEFGCAKFYLTVNYKGKMIQSYFDNAENGYDIHLIWEEDLSGTAGSLRLVAELIRQPDIFVSNCDILVKADYADIYKFHTTHDCDITVVGSMQHHFVPYGVLEIKNGGLLQSLVEKPEYDFLVNTGMYVIKKKVIDMIPAGTFFHFTDLIAKVKGTGGNVRVYPVAEDAWVDLGQWQEYQTALKNLEI